MIKIFSYIIILLIMSNKTFAESLYFKTSGQIKHVEVLKKYITKQIPKKEKICEIKRLPANQASDNFGADNLIGALIGGAIGNQLGKGGGKQGSTAIGALIGSEVVRNNKQANANTNDFVEKEVCRVQNIIHTETVEKISGYKLSIEVDNDIITMNSNKSFNVGDLISINKKVIYSFN